MGIVPNGAANEAKLNPSWDLQDHLTWRPNTGREIRRGFSFGAGPRPQCTLSLSRNDKEATGFPGNIDSNR
jgi:hypothetical protein